MNSKPFPVSKTSKVGEDLTDAELAAIAGGDTIPDGGYLGNQGPGTGAPPRPHVISG